jgi:hypothetical protein
LVNFLETLFRGATKLVVGSDEALAPILKRFTSVTILDSSTITLPEEMKEQFPGCGGSYGSSAAGEYFLSRLQFGTAVGPRDAPAVELLRWLRPLRGQLSHFARFFAVDGVVDFLAVDRHFRRKVNRKTDPVALDFDDLDEDVFADDDALVLLARHDVHHSTPRKR